MRYNLTAMKNNTYGHSNLKQGTLPLFFSELLNICNPVLTFDRLLEEINIDAYLDVIPKHVKGRLRYNLVNMLKTVLFGFMTRGYISLRELEDSYKVNLRFMYLMDGETPSYHTFGDFINKVLGSSIEDIFNDVTKKIMDAEQVDLNHLYIDGTKLEANTNKYAWVWKKASEKSRYKLFAKITKLFEEINESLQYQGVTIMTNTEYAPEYLHQIQDTLKQVWELDESKFVHGKGHRKSPEQRWYEQLEAYTEKLE